MRSGKLDGKWVWLLRTVLSLFSVVAEDLTPEIANGQLPRAQHSRAHTSSSLSGHCTLLLDNFLAHFLEVAELSLGDVLSLDCAENLLDALLVLNLVESWLLEAKVFKATAPQFPSEPTPERLNGI